VVKDRKENCGMANQYTGVITIGGVAGSLEKWTMKSKSVDENVEGEERKGLEVSGGRGEEENQRCGRCGCGGALLERGVERRGQEGDETNRSAV
jgi:hypothetical protein